MEQSAVLDDSGDLRWIANVNRYFHLSESLRQTAARPWWDFLLMALAIHYELASIPKES